MSLSTDFTVYCDYLTPFGICKVLVCCYSTWEPVIYYCSLFATVSSSSQLFLAAEIIRGSRHGGL